MKNQDQASNILHAVSLQLTHYLNDWMFEKKGIAPNKIKAMPNTSNQISFKHQPKNLQKQQQKTYTKQKQKDKQKQKTEVCRIQYPIIQSRSKSSKDLFLPLIRTKNIIYQQDKSKLIKINSQHKLLKTRTPNSLNSVLISTNNIQKHQKQIIYKLKRKRKRSPKLINNAHNNLHRQVQQMDITDMKALLMKQLKNNRVSAHKSNKNKNYKNIGHKQQILSVKQSIRQNHK